MVRTKPRKFCFCVTAAARPLCLPWTTKCAVVAQQVTQRRQRGGRTIAKVAEGLPWSPNGGTMVATVIAQWTLLVGQRRHNGGTRKAEALLKLIHNVHNSTYYLRGDQWPTTVHPFCHYGDVSAFLLPPLSDPWATNLLRDLCATVLNMLKTSRRRWRPWRCLNVLCTTTERPRQPFCLLSAFNGDPVSFVVAQWRQKGRSPCVKGVLRSGSFMLLCITRLQWVNTLRPRKNGRYFPDGIFKCIFLNENVWISINISLTFIPKGQINNMPTLVRIMA